MARTTAELVKGVLLKDYDGCSSLAPFIRTAGIVTSKVASLAAAKGDPQDADTLKEIETWLAAHFYQQADPGYLSRSTEGASGSFKGEKGTGFLSTNYGATALKLDFSGVLASLDKRAFAGLTWLGKPEGDRLSYDDRQ